MTSFQALVTDRFDVDAFVRLEKAVQTSRASSPDLSTTDLSNVNGLVIRSRTKITKALLQKAPQLKVIVTSTSGYDHIDLTACEAAGVKVMYTPNANAASACELTWGLVIAAARKVPKAHAMVKAGDWNREPLMGQQLSGQTYGIIGLGRIGTRVALVAKAFGMKVVAYDPYIEDFGFCERVGLDELFKLADIVSVHVPATPETDNMISHALLKEGNQGLIFVNTSRGSVIKEDLLIQALETGWISACGLDVFEKEPLSKESRLLGRDNVVLTPHIGATTTEAFKAASIEAADKMIAFAQHGAVTDALPGDQPWA